MNNTAMREKASTPSNAMLRLITPTKACAPVAAPIKANGGRAMMQIAHL
eukprot:CAMPEP_0115313974 /NCGR_PEP_ID=MMETSP0270-20121206/76772_1 /TAXON_ID=71861 /ORGANISM="Scrippsiella trochoidea, Strain CCMP3099" /LENGTH=48 /DNA_ID= /DNA_START= /DNA_END= /DNA_ORIENTATION=